MTHTPGPWSVEAIYALLRFGRKSGGSWDDIGEEHEFFPDEDDASLIAAAPEMLEALEAMVEMVEMNGLGKRYALDLAASAIKKARGEK
jgi:hypothetical protein